MKNTNQLKKDFKDLRLVIRGKASIYKAFSLGQKYPYYSVLYFAAYEAEFKDSKFSLRLRLEHFRETGLIVAVRNFA
ncbi:conserved hypothetical protein [Vibrio chagasii]|uniref:hypothetical protein n=1 Tax=Vibrio TaxID=662 RepID=UPI000C84A5D3|nr:MULTISPECIES: hypothetical protein [Vibrio]CAH7072555.1 conserved hypothetical protein [Vibrio chagasii]MCQ8870082.1 hypothetical protein [Vibrio splendidus]PMI62684.1 hypothetical protein BCU40_24900 [Vibrio lentus]PMI66120.1 hypothetical protein BCU40_10780 [Vibrio lentus]TCT64587.1 hypothetical protein EDB31_12728 [Vibrio crassostreae]